MSTPKWLDRTRLADHHRKRLRKKEIPCWQEILGLNRPMTEAEYEAQSYRSFNTGVIEYDSFHEREHGRTISRVDKKAVFTAANKTGKCMRTCYHEHYGFPHKAGSAAPSIENVLTFIGDLDAQVDGGELELYRIDFVQVKMKKSKIGQRLKSLRKKCVKDV